MTDKGMFLATPHDAALEILLAKEIAADPIAPFDLPAQVYSLVEEHQSELVVVNLSALTRCTTVLVNGLLTLHRMLSQQHLPMMLCEVPPIIQEILQELNLEGSVFEVFPSLNEAINSLGGE